MHSPARAIAWELWARSRGGIGAFVVCLLGLSLGACLLPHGSAREPIFPLSVILFALGSVYLASVVMHCEYHEGTLSAGYPSRMFTLPVRTSVLVAWPMLYGTAALTLLWLAMVLLIWMPAGTEPAWWVVPLLAVALAWLQAIFWAVPGSPLAKILAACVILPALKMTLEFVATSVALFVDPQSRLDRAAFIESRHLIITTFSIGFLPLAYVVAVGGVACDRRGTRPDWAWTGRLLERAGNWLPQRRQPFSSAASAQFWIEWRCKGFVLPLFPACFLVFITLVVVPFASTRQLLPLLLFLGGAVPVVAFVVGYGVGKSGFWSEDLSLSTWQATRPLSSGALATAKLHMAAISSLMTWVLLLFGIPVWLVALRRFGAMAELLEPSLRPWTPHQIAGLGVLGFCGLLTLTWGQMVGGLCLTLTGRTWIVNGAIAFYLTLLTCLGLTGQWVYAHPGDFETSLTALSWCLCGIAGVKLFGAAWVFCVVGRQKLLSRIHMGVFLSIWLLGACCLVTLPYALLPADGLPLPAEIGASVNHLPASLVALATVVALPLLRLIAAPLALAASRHR
ncbi:MAG: hypothetical protein AABP62_26725 [Planctomycetota bacterium]